MVFLFYVTFPKKRCLTNRKAKEMADIIKSGLLGIAWVGTLIFSAPLLNDTEDKRIVVAAEEVELKTENDICTPL
ncbi:hypothetical protein FGF1_24060 [Flavobacteriaceae bacterium GF1]